MLEMIPALQKGLWKYVYPSSKVMKPTPSVYGTNAELSAPSYR